MGGFLFASIPDIFAAYTLPSRYPAMPTSPGLDAALAFTLRPDVEGGVSNTPGDPGGLTNGGVTQATYDAWRIRNGYPKQPVTQMLQLEQYTIYKEMFWDRINGDKLPIPLAVAVFDFAVNSGVSNAVTHLQCVLGIKMDGVLGSKTIAAIAERDTMRLVDALCTARLSFMRGLHTWAEFGKDWSRRVSDLNTYCESLAVK